MCRTLEEGVCTWVLLWLGVRGQPEGGLLSHSGLWRALCPPYIHGTARCFCGFASLRRCVFELSFTQRSSGSLNECSSKTAPLKTPIYSFPPLRCSGLKHASQYSSTPLDGFAVWEFTQNTDCVSRRWLPSTWFCIFMRFCKYDLSSVLSLSAKWGQKCLLLSISLCLCPPIYKMKVSYEGGKPLFCD